MKLLHVRHSTSLLEYAGCRILIDPLLAPKSAYSALPLTPRQRRNPLTELSTPIEKLLNTDLILSTHAHPDHFDENAKQLLNKNTELVCQPSDFKTFTAWGFLKVSPVETSVNIKNITISRVSAQHGAGVFGKLMGPSSGYLLSANGEPTVYITGDTIYNEKVKANIENYSPEILIINAGSPKFLISAPIVNTINDIEAILKIKSNLKFIVVHLDAYNHCIETREDVNRYFSEEKLRELSVEHFYVPRDNELLEL